MFKFEDPNEHVKFGENHLTQVLSKFYDKILKSKEIPTD